MNRKDIPELRDGDKLYVRHRWAHDPTTYVYEATVTQNDKANTLVFLTIHYPGQDEPTILYYSGRTPHRHGYLVTDFFRAMPTEDHIGPFVYRPAPTR